ncbi:MAG TPA: glycosyltransferase family 2 protein [Gemmatimonas sp.]|nr:glycosyltransferase family 2 protein [Gemmatimonas sp.]
MIHQQQQLLSVVVPCFNEEAVIDETHRELSRVVSRLESLDYEIIYVDDGSHDLTPERLEALQEGDAHVRVIRLSRNFGHQLAVTAGLEHAEGDAVVLIDSDLQDPPEVIPLMIARWREGYDVAYGERVSRDGETAFKKATARAFYRVLNRLTETRIPLDAGDFRLMDRRVIDALRTMPERDRFVRGLVSWVGFRQVAVPYRRASRFAGVSKYPLSKMLRFALDGILSFSSSPLRAITAIGLAILTIAMLAAVYALARGLFGGDQLSSISTMLIGLLLMGGVQLLAIGIVGEYVGRVYGQAKGRPLYLVRQRMGFERPVGPQLERRDAQPRRQSERATRYGARLHGRERSAP